MTPKIDEKNRQHSPTLEKALCRAPFLAYGILWRSPCHPAAAEGAKLSKISEEWQFLHTWRVICHVTAEYI